MKTTITILAFFLVTAFTLNAQEVALTYHHIKSDEDVKFTQPDFSKLDITREKNSDLYSVTIPFKITVVPPKGEIFWLMLYIPNESSFDSWGIFDSDGNFISKNYTYLSDDNGYYYVQSQQNLKEEIRKGEYKLKLNFKKEPDPKYDGIGISIGYSEKSFYEETFGFPSSTKEELVKYINDLYKKSYKYTDENGEKITVKSITLEGKTLVRKLSDGRVTKTDLAATKDLEVQTLPKRGNYYISDGNENFLFEISTEVDAYHLKDALNRLKKILIKQ